MSISTTINIKIINPNKLPKKPNTAPNPPNKQRQMRIIHKIVVMLFIIYYIYVKLIQKFFFHKILFIFIG